MCADEKIAILCRKLILLIADRLTSKTSNASKIR